MRPSEFEAIRPHLQEAFDHIDAYLKRQQEIEEEAPKSWEAALAGSLPKANLRTLTEEEQEEAVRIFRSRPPTLIEHGYPWRHSSAQAAVWLRDAGWITEAKAIGDVLGGLPTGPLDGNNPENMARQFEAIRAGAERIKTILTTCLAGPKDQGEQPQADQGGTNDDPDTRLPATKLADRLHIPERDAKARDALRKRLESWRKANLDGGWIETRDPKPREPRYLYPLRRVWPLIQDLKPSG